MPESYHGYTATDLYATDAHFGTLEEYRRLSDALHARGMKLVIDLVPNHVGVQHPWVLDPRRLIGFMGRFRSITQCNMISWSLSIRMLPGKRGAILPAAGLPSLCPT
jgi:hypothetical protein